MVELRMIRNGIWRHSAIFSWQPWAFSLAYSLWMLTAASYSMQFMTLYLTAKQIYTQTQIYIPDAISCVNLITMIASGILIDLIRRGWPVCLFVGMLHIVAFAILRSPNENVKLRLFGFILTGVYGCYTPFLSGWANISCGKDPKLRAFTLAVMIAIGTSVSTPFQQYVFPSSEAPYYQKKNGFSYALVSTVLLTIWTVVGIPLTESGLINADFSIKDESPVLMDLNVNKKKVHFTLTRLHRVTCYVPGSVIKLLFKPQKYRYLNAISIRLFS